MSDGAHVRATAALDELDRALGVFAGHARDVMDGSAAELCAALEHLDERCGARRAAVADCEEKVHELEHDLEASYGDDEDGGGYDPDIEKELEDARGELEEARGQLAAAIGWMQRVRAEAAEYRAEARRFAATWAETRARAQAFLRASTRDIGAYAAIGTPIAAAEIGAAASVGFGSSVATDAGPVETERGHSGTVAADAMVAAAALRTLPGLAPGAWRSMSLRERYEAVLDIEATMARLQGRPARRVEIGSLGREVSGEYDPATRRILLSPECLRGEDKSRQRALGTIVHEGRHAYQQDAIERPGLHADTAEVEAWRANLAPGHYRSPDRDGVQRYYLQPVERDAFAYEDRVLGALALQGSEARDG